MSKVGGKRKPVEPTDYENVMELTDYETEMNENIWLRI